MKKILTSVSVVLLAAASFSGAADARPGHGRGHAYGRYKNEAVQRYAAPRRHNDAAIAAGVTGAIIGGVLGATAQPAYRTYERPAYRDYEPRRRTYYREEYYDNGY